MTDEAVNVNNRHVLPPGSYSLLPKYVRDAGALRTLLPAELRVYMALVLEARWRAGGTVEGLSEKMLIDQTGLSERAVRSAIKGLASKRLIRVDRTGCGAGHTAIYTVVAGKPAAACPLSVGRTRQIRDSKPGTGVPKTRQKDDGNPARACPPSNRVDKEAKIRSREGAASERALRSNAAVAAAGKNTGASRAEIVVLMGERGADESLRGFVSKDADVKLVRRIAEAYDRNTLPIKNAGGWWRDQLRRAGVPGV